MKKFMLLSVILVLTLVTTGCSIRGLNLSVKNQVSNLTGINRTVKVYHIDGTLVKSYSGKITFSDSSTSGDVTIIYELNGKLKRDDFFGPFYIISEEQ